MRSWIPATLAAFQIFLAAGGAASAQTVTTIRVGTIAVEANGPLFYAQALGYFQAAGIDVQVTALNSGPSTAAAVIGGSIDIGVANVSTIAQARNRGIPLVFLAPGAVTSPTSLTNVIMVSKDSPIRTAADLNGKTIAVNGLKDLQNLAVSSWMDKHGGDSSTVKFTEIPPPQMAAALEAHRVDAAKGDEPFITTAKGSIRILGNAMDGIAPRFMIIGWFATEKWASEHPDLALKFARAIEKASIWANGHDPESLAIFLQNTKLDPTIAASMARSRYQATIEPALIQPVLDASVKYGFIDHVVPAGDLIWRGAK